MLKRKFPQLHWFSDEKLLRNPVAATQLWTRQALVIASTTMTGSSLWRPTLYNKTKCMTYRPS